MEDCSPSALSTRELECIKWAANGYSAKEIAYKMSINARTVESHLNHARLKIGARNRVHAAVFAVRKGWI